ncbi:MAG: ABC transporter permease [Chloroflexi bacterium]|nr:ABC transporter permease [Chloroflexota bacterium]
MKRIIYIAWKDITQVLRYPVAGLFLLVLPLVFTAFFGILFGGINNSDEQIEVPVLAAVSAEDDWTRVETMFPQLFNSSEFQIEKMTQDWMERPQDLLQDEIFAGVLVIPNDFSFSENSEKLLLYVDQTSDSGQVLIYTVETILKEAQLIDSSVNKALQAVDMLAPYINDADYQLAYERVEKHAQQLWRNKALQVDMEKAVAPSTDLSELESSYDQSSPGMLVQFAISGLMGIAIILVQERKTRTLQRMMTTATSRASIIIGHALSMVIIFVLQQIILVLAGKFLFGVDYLRQPFAILLVIVAFALWVSGMGMLIGVAAKNEDQVILFSLIAMFLFTAMGGAWFPLEGTSAGFYNIARYTPGAQAMQGFQNIIVRKLGLASVIEPVGLLLLYAVAFFTAAILLFKKIEN